MAPPNSKASASSTATPRKDLHRAQYMLLGTRKRDGSFVPTPVWCAGDDSTLYMFSAGDAGKVKRLRNFSECRVAPCTVTGKRLEADQNASATLVSGEDAQRAHRALVKKYGWQMRLLDIGAGLAGRKKRRAFIRVDLGPTDPA